MSWKETAVEVYEQTLPEGPEAFIDALEILVQRGVLPDGVFDWLDGTEGLDALRAVTPSVAEATQAEQAGSRSRLAVFLWIQAAKRSRPLPQTTLLTTEMPPRQWEAYTHVLSKIATSNINEVGMSRNELAAMSENEHGPKHAMSVDAARRALESLVNGGYLRRTAAPTLRMNREAASRQRARGGRPYYFYSVPWATVPDSLVVAAA